MNDCPRQNPAYRPTPLPFSVSGAMLFTRARSPQMAVLA
jgi:hypothetical protein